MAQHAEAGDSRIRGTDGRAREVTAREVADAYREAGWNVLRVLNEPGTWRDAMRRVLAVLKSQSGADAVGIRLQDGDDFPYFVEDGFPESFLRTENTLLRRDSAGGVCRSKNGEASLECTCGLVLSGRGSPLLTRWGSFWTNDSFPLLDLPIDQDPRLNPRNQCIHHGYGSVALVPIRARENIVGLLHFNHRSRGRFSTESVEALEGIAAHVGEALLRKRSDEALAESEQSLRDHQKRLQAMAFEATVAEARERRRLAMILHDGIGQDLAVMQLKLTALRESLTGPSRAAVDEVLAIVQQSIQVSRSITFELSPPILYDLGIGPALSWLAEEMEKKPGMRIVLSDDNANKPMDDTTATMVFRAVRELLMNVFKHAESPSAEVSLRRVGDYLEVTVTDAGIGFDPKAVAPGGDTGGFGIMSLREQISRLGGTVDITSVKGEGTVARVQAPLRGA